MEDLKLKKRYEKAMEINNKLYDYLSKFIKCDKFFYKGYCNYHGISKVEEFWIHSNESKYGDITIGLDVYICDLDEFILHMSRWNESNWAKNIAPSEDKIFRNLSWETVESPDFIEFAKNEFFKYCELDKINKAYEQLALF